MSRLADVVDQVIGLSPELQEFIDGDEVLSRLVNECAQKYEVVARVRRNETTFSQMVHPVVIANLQIRFPYFNSRVNRKEYQIQALGIKNDLNEVLDVTDGDWWDVTKGLMITPRMRFILGFQTLLFVLMWIVAIAFGLVWMGLILTLVFWSGIFLDIVERFSFQAEARRKTVEKLVDKAAELDLLVRLA